MKDEAALKLQQQADRYLGASDFYMMVGDFESAKFWQQVSAAAVRMMDAERKEAA
jgi:hypothetical protein